MTCDALAVDERLPERVAERRDVARRDEACTLFDPLAGFDVAVDGIGDDRGAEGERFQQGVGHAFPAGRADERSGSTDFREHGG